MRRITVAVIAIAVAWTNPARALIVDRSNCDIVVQFDGTLHFCGGTGTLPEMEVLLEACRKATRGISAWKTRDAEGFLADTPKDFTYKRPDGSVVTRADMVADLVRRMAMTVSIDSIVVALRVDSLQADSAIIRSRQTFVRVIAMPDGARRRRITGVTHREVWRRRDDLWALKGFAEEDQVARWEDETGK